METENGNQDLKANESMSSLAQNAFRQKLEEYMSANGEADVLTQAKLFAEAVELQILKTPSIAKFCSLDEMFCSAESNGLYVVKGYVDSQNSYGAMVRTPFVLRVFCDNGTWKTVDFFTKKNVGVLFGGFFMMVGIALDIVSMFEIDEDFDVFKGLLIAGSITFFIGMVITILSKFKRR